MKIIDWVQQPAPTAAMGEELSFDHSWFFTSLNKGSSRCAAHIPDTVVVKDGVALRWLFTSAKTGEVMKKRSVDPKFLHESFVRAASADITNADEFVAVVWPSMGNLPRVLDRPAFDDFMKSFAANLGGVAAVQAYLHPRGGDGTIYVNEFTVVDDATGRHTTSTSKHLRQLTRSPAALDRSTVAKSRDSRMNEQLDGMTWSLLRYFETTNRVRVKNIVVEYVVDHDSQPHVLRARDIIAVKLAAPSKAKPEAAPAAARRKCAGDFCEHAIDGPVRRQSALDIARQFFTAEEVDSLVGKLDTTVAPVAVPGNEAPYALTYKSVITARQDRQRLTELQGGGSGDASSAADSMPTHLRTTVAQARRDKWGASRGAVEGGASNYYKEVRLCASCYLVYHTLDRARALLRGDTVGDHVDKARELLQSAPEARRGSTPGGMSPPRRRPKPQAKTPAGTTKRRLRAPRRSQGGASRTAKPGAVSKAVSLPTLARSAGYKPSSPQAPIRRRAFEEKARPASRAPPSRGNNVSTPPRATRPPVRASSRGGASRGSPLFKPARGMGSPPSPLEAVPPRGLSSVGSLSWEDPAEDSSSPSPPRAPLRDTGPSTARSTASVGDGWRGHVLIVDNDGPAVRAASKVLTEAGYQVKVTTKGPKALSITRAETFDCMLVGRDVPALSGVEVCRIIRQREEGMQAANVGGEDVSRLPMIVFTDKTDQEDLREYMTVGMDGCVSKPVDATALLNTIAAAVPQPRRPPPHPTMSPVHVPRAVGKTSRAPSDLVPSAGPVSSRGRHPLLAPKFKPTVDVSQFGPGGLSSLGGSSAVAAAFDTSAEGGLGEAAQRVFRPSDDVAMPYLVLGKAHPHTPMFPIVVINDLFDTFETFQIFFRPFVAKYPGLQVVLFNLPGQAGTAWPPHQVLNNEYHAECVRELLKHVATTGEFVPEDTKQPYFVMGVGNGANVASCFSMRHSHEFPSMRALVLVNAFLHVDSALAGILHDSVNVFSCTPDSRPDLPVYFFSRFLFSKEYLTKVGAPLALNMYTAVDNPITTEGRVALCNGALAHADLRASVRALAVPTLLVTSSSDGLVAPEHSTAHVAARGGSLDSDGQELTVKQVLHSTPARAAIVWLAAGHEVFQECRQAMGNLLEQLVTGFHDRNDVRFPRVGDSSVGPGIGAAVMVGIDAPSASLSKPSLVSGGGLSSKTKSRRPAPTPGKAEDRYLDSVLADGRSRRPAPQQGMPSSSAPAPEATSVPEVREYMQWRVRRNKKRLARLEGSVIMIQRAFRSYLARTLAQRTRNHAHALTLQRWWRGEMGRARFRSRKEMDWAARLLQAHWRGYSGRALIWRMYEEHRAAINIQRVWRGYMASRWTSLLKEARLQAAIKIQTCYRSHLAMLQAYRRRDERNAAVNIQRLYRGRLGRLRAQRERDRFLFSRSQTQGIEFGRQMLTEHRLHGTRLQSEVALLSREKRETEERLEAVLEEISTFEAGVRGLEREMAQLSRAEAEAAGMLDESAKVELRENKLRLDREFSTMLVKIADRRETLQALEKQLQALDRSRRKKKEALRDLERKLVVLLEEQQSELDAIKQRQDKTSTAIIDDAVARVKSDMSSSKPGAVSGGRPTTADPLALDNNTPGGAGAPSGGPTPQQRAEASSLMASTETMMKFGFMSMSLTYFSSLNMIRAMRQVGTANTLMSNPALQMVMGSTPDPSAPGGSVPTKPVASGTKFTPSLAAGKFPGQETTDVTLWTVDDVAEWLESLSLGQYTHVFAEAAVDGAFLYDLTEEDLRNTLGIEHNLHRKKILTAVHRMRGHAPAAGKMEPSAGRPSISMPDMGPGGPGSVMEHSSVYSTASAAMGAMVPHNSSIGSAGAGGFDGSTDSAPPSGPLRLDDLMSWVRHNKSRKLATALASAPDSLFDFSQVVTPYLDGYGTQYNETLNRLVFHINSSNDHGNTLLTVACQNGHQKIAALLIRKGANPNHQNNQGNTAMHYAMTYKFFDLGVWLADPDKGGADDTILNQVGLTPYDGLGE